MGNCQACLASGSVHDAGEEESVKVVRVTDGQLFEYPGPVYVKDLMHGFEGFGVFQYSTVKLPLPPETELKFTEIYYLRPWTPKEESPKPLGSGELESPRKPGGLRSPQSKSVQVAVAKVKKVRFLDVDHRQSAQDVASPRSLAATARSLEDGHPGMKLLTTEPNGVIRLKLVISKKQLSELMATNNQQTDTLVERIIAPLLSPKSAATIENAGSSSPTASWRPSLEHIPESE